MTGIYVGGLRARLVKDSLFVTIKNGLTDLGWFSPGRQHAPVTLEPEARDLGIPIPPNTIAIGDESITSPAAEIGSSFAEHRWPFIVDVFAENSTLGLHLSRDIKDMVEGRMPSIGRNSPIINVYDWTMATPPLIFFVEVYDAAVDRAHNFPEPYLRHWYSVSFSLYDYYGDETDGT